MQIDDQAASFGMTFYRMEVDRIKYLIARYLRVRLLKIEQQSEYIIENDIIKDKLSIQERIFIDKLTSLNSQHFRNCIYNSINNNALKKQMVKRNDIITHFTPSLSVNRLLIFF